MKLSSSFSPAALKMAKPLLNGSGTGVDATDEDAAAAATMVAAIQDHLASCNKNLPTQENNFGGITIKEERFTCDFDHMYASMTEQEGATATEVRQLKELLLLHLDLIQQQSEQIVNKDKQLQNLRQENEMLRLRLERMDRRVTLHHNKRHMVIEPPSNLGTDAESPSTLSELPGSEDDGDSNPPQPFPKVEGSLSPRGSPLTVGTKHLTLPERACRSRKSSWSSDTGTAVSRRSCGSDRGGESSTRGRDESPASSGPPAKRTRTTRRQTNDTETSTASPASTTEPETSRLMKMKTPLPLMTTRVAYYRPPIEDVELIDSEKVKQPSSQTLLEVPSWRIKHYTSCYSMEGTENLEDEIFLKRHQRLELDERRRKRWDIQRLREQRQYEKLRQRQSQQQQLNAGRRAAGSAAGSSSRKKSPHREPTELWPDPDQVQFIEVTDKLPVTAFGVPLPTFPPAYFELPWEVEQETLEQEEKEEETAACAIKIKQEPPEEPPAAPPPSPDLPPPPPPPTTRARPSTSSPSPSSSSCSSSSTRSPATRATTSRRSTSSVSTPTASTSSASPSTSSSAGARESRRHSTRRR